MDLDDFKMSNLNIDTWALNDDGARVLKIIKGLQRNHELYGHAYCPCKLDRTEENICPCKEYKSTSVCKCGLYKQLS